MGCVECKPKDPCREVTICECPIKDLQTDCSVYVGEDLNDINVKSGTILTTVLEKISNQFKRLKEYVDKSFEVRNVGDGISLYRGNHNVDGAKEIKTLIAGEGIELEESFNNKEVTIKATFEGGTEYIAGKDIKIEDNIISYDGIEYTAGDNINIGPDGIISSENTKYKPGNKIEISSDNTISYTGGDSPINEYTIESLGDKSVYKEQEGGTFKFRGITSQEGGPIEITETPDNIEIGIDATSLGKVKNYPGEMLYSVKAVNEEDDYVKVFVANPSTGLKFRDATTHIIIEAQESAGVEEIIINPGLPEGYIPSDINPIYRNIDELRTALERTDPLLLSPNATLRVYNGYTGNVTIDGNNITEIRNYIIPPGVVMDVNISDDIDRDIVFQGGGELSISRLHTNSTVDIIGSIISNNTPIEGTETSSINIIDSVLKKTNNVKTNGNLKVSGTIFNYVDGDTGKNIIITGSPSVNIETSTFSRAGIVDASLSEDLDIELKGNVVTKGVTGSIVEGSGSKINIRSFGNILEGSTIITDTSSLESYGDVSNKGVIQNLKEFPDKASALSSLGPGILYLRKEDKEKVVDYTYEPEP